MSKKYLLHRITEEDASYIAEETGAGSSQFRNGNCYLLVNKNNGKVFLENGNLLIYKSSYPLPGIDLEKRKFIEAIEACAFFRGYANIHEINFKTSKISELLYELEDHEIEISNSCEDVEVQSSGWFSHTAGREVAEYIGKALDGYDILHDLQRNLPTLALFINEIIPTPEEEEEMEDDIEF